MDDYNSSSAMSAAAAASSSNYDSEYGSATGDLFTFNGSSTGTTSLGRNFSYGLETTSQHSVVHKTQDGVFESGIIIPLYVVIFILSVVGNSLVLVTLGQNKRMRTITNVYLLNLAVSDLLLGVFCMPFTLVGQVLRNFIFGAAMCKMIPYFQAVSVSVGVWTLVAISLERYFAICRPLKSRRWQTQFHAYKMIAFVWISSLMWTSPILLVSRLKALKMGRHKCREEWPNPTSEKVFNMFLDIVLLLVPLIIMTMAYSLIVSKLWKGLKHEIKHSSNCMPRQDRCSSTATVNGVILNKDDEHDVGHRRGSYRQGIPLTTCSSRGIIRNQGRTKRELLSSRANSRKSCRMKMWLKKVSLSNRDPKNGSLSSSVIALPVLTSSPRSNNGDNIQAGEGAFAESSACNEATRYTFTRHAIRSNYMDKSIEAKKKVIRMLFVVVAEFFICWAPLHILNTWYLFSPEVIYKYVGATGISLVQLLAYISSCCNPITYCFMNRKFRQAFLNIFSCYRACRTSEDRTDGMKRSCHLPAVNNSEMSGNDSTAYPARIISTLNRSEVVVLESEDRV